MTEPTAVSDAAADPEQIRTLLANADRRLLGDAIAVSDDEWRAPTALPGWSRAHVATHLARHADAFARLANWARTGVEQEMYPGDRDAEIAAGAGRDALQIQTDLDTSIGRLEQEFEQTAEAHAWDAEVRLRDGSRLPARLLPLGRLFEVVVHHVDLGLRFGVDDIDEQTGTRCLEWAAIRQRRRQDYPPLRLTTAGGSEIELGGRRGASPAAISGPAGRLLGWLTRRSGTDGLQGDLVELPSFG